MQPFEHSRRLVKPSSILKGFGLVSFHHDLRTQERPKRAEKFSKEVQGLKLTSNKDPQKAAPACISGGFPSLFPSSTEEKHPPFEVRRPC